MEQLRQNEVGKTIPFPARAMTKPVFRWLGGKSWLVPHLSKGILNKISSTGGRYFEPFLGGAAIALDLGLPKMFLSDKLDILISTYAEIASDPLGFLRDFEAQNFQGTEEEFYEQREAFNQSAAYGRMEAIRFLYLNATCFNGVSRFNKTGGFNVPFGKRKNPGFPTKDHLMQIAYSFRSSTLTSMDFRESIEEAKKGDVIFADPPYVGTFVDYSKGGFSEEDQEDLAVSLHEAHKRGATVVSTNSNHPTIRGFYEDWCTLIETFEPRFVASKAASRGESTCLVVTTDPNIVRGDLH